MMMMMMMMMMLIWSFFSNYAYYAVGDTWVHITSPASQPAGQPSVPFL
jgi:hypothetical protein